MTLRPMGDLIIFLPGIMGSVLAKDGKVLWGLSLKMLPRARQFEQFVRELALAGDDPERPLLDDGVVATALLPDAHLIPGFWKIDGYTSLIDALRGQFDVKLGSVQAPAEDANLLPFPYDWRRDNRANARRLERFITEQLPAWKRASGNPDAKVILIGHSMGGLIARYYLECLGGAETCRALVTFGTPYRGSLNALNSIVNGERLLGLFDVSPALRSFTSVYQLLPTYPAINLGGGYVGVTAAGAIPQLDLARATEALTGFHQPMETQARTRAEAGLPMPYGSFLIIGTNQPTNQSALLNGSALTVSAELPELKRLRALPGYGDSTVPFYSALPAGTRPRDHTLCYGVERHSALQCNLHLQEQLLETLHVLQGGGDILGAASFEAGDQPGLRLLIDDAYPAEGGVIRVEPVAITGDPGELLVTLTALDEQRPPEQRRLAFVDGAWQVELERPDAGVYRISAELYRIGGGAVRPVQDLFEVVPASQV